MIDPSKLPRLKDAFAGPGFYLDEQSMREAIREGGMFNLQDRFLGPHGFGLRPFTVLQALWGGSFRTGVGGFFP